MGGRIRIGVLLYFILTVLTGSRIRLNSYVGCPDTVYQIKHELLVRGIGDTENFLYLHFMFHTKGWG